ncbi:MAG: extracellular solute-binding protein, partial [Verrucomicrobia bacterium]|nr:extracellular solute-binding protein [Verrucomicrobiota bacterium]
MNPRYRSFWVSALLTFLWLAAGSPATAGELLYEDRFASLDPSWRPLSDAVSVDHGKLILAPAPNTSQAILNQSQRFGDSEITVDITTAAGDPAAPGGLIFWAADSDNFYCFCINAKGYYKIIRYVGSKPLDQLDWTPSEAINKGLGQVNSVRLVTAGRQATVYINDQREVTFNGQPPPDRGLIGLAGDSGGNSATVWQFANLRVIAGSSPAPAPLPPFYPSPLMAAAAALAAAEDVVAIPGAAVPAATPSLPAALPAFPAAPPARRVALRLHGANTVGAELAAMICEDFLKHEGATSIQRRPGPRENETNIEALLPNESADRLIFEIQAHGSKTAFEDLATGGCDIGMSSRRVQPDEAQRCARAGLGDLFSSDCEHTLGLDGIAVLVNKHNPVNALTTQQLAGIFSGKINDWSQVGGPSGVINLYALNDNSGTFDTFKSVVLGGQPLSAAAVRYENSAKLADDVAADRNGIGFAGMSFVRNSKPVAVAEAGADPLVPTPFTIATQEYLLSRRLYLYTPANPQNPWTRRFIEFARPKLEVFSWLTSGSEALALEALIENYKHEYPGITVINDTVSGGSGSAARPVLQRRLAAGKPPDVWQSHAGWELFGQYVGPGYCEPVTDLYRSGGWDRAFPKPLRDLVTRDGKIYAVPAGIHRGNVLWYNKKLLEQHGIEVGNRMAFDEFFAACDKLEAAGIPALGMGDSGIWASAQLFENTLLGVIGPHGWTELFSGRMRWDDPKVKQAMQYFARMQSYLNSDHAALSWDQAIKKLRDGKAGFFSMGDWAEGEFARANLKADVDFGWVSFPGTEGSFLVVVDAFALASAAPHKEAGIAWLKSIGTKDAQETFSALNGGIPARTDVDPAAFDSYQRWAMADFNRDNLLPSCVHGSAAPAAFRQALDDAVAAFVADRNVDTFAGALTQAARQAGQNVIARVDFEERTVKPEVSEAAPPPQTPAGSENKVHHAETQNLALLSPPRLPVPAPTPVPAPVSIAPA